MTDSGAPINEWDRDLAALEVTKALEQGRALLDIVWDLMAHGWAAREAQEFVQRTAAAMALATLDPWVVELRGAAVMGRRGGLYGRPPRC